MTAHIQMSLTHDLQRFGLNPQDWALQVLNSSLEFRLQHRQDPAFTLWGKGALRNHDFHWLVLELLSL